MVRNCKSIGNVPSLVSPNHHLCEDVAHDAAPAGEAFFSNAENAHSLSAISRYSVRSRDELQQVHAIGNAMDWDNISAGVEPLCEIRKARFRNVLEHLREAEREQLGRCHP